MANTTEPVGNNAQGRRVREPIERSVKHRPASSNDLLGFLGDKIVLPEPFDEVISIGDVVVALEILIPLAGGLIGVLWVTAGPTVAIVVASATLIGISLGVLWRRHRPESEPIDEELALGAVMLAMFDGLPDSVDSH